MINALGLKSLKNNMYTRCWHLSHPRVAHAQACLRICAYTYYGYIHAQIQKVLSEIQEFLKVFFFLVDEVIEDPKTSSPASETPFKWRFAGVPIMAKLVFLWFFFQGIQADMWFFRVGGSGPTPPLDPPMTRRKFRHLAPLDTSAKAFIRLAFAHMW